MATWSPGDIVTSAWMNSIEKILALGTYGATTSPRLTEAPNSTFDLIGGAVATNHRLNGSIAVGDTKYYAWLDARTLTSVITGTVNTPYAAVLTYDHQTTVASGAGAYGIVGAVVGNSGAGKISSIYGRSSVGAGFTGTYVAGTFAVSLAANAGGGSIMNVGYDCTGSFQVPVGILFNCNTAGTGSLGTAIAIDSTVTVGSSILTWNQRAGTTAPLVIMNNSSTVRLFDIDYLGNINFKTVGAATGNRITGDMTNSTFKSRLAFQTSTADSATVLGIIPSGTALVSQLSLYNANDPDNAGRLSIQANSTAHTINSTAKGTGSTLNFGLQNGGTTLINLTALKDTYLGPSAAAAADTAGHIYIQAIDGTPSGTPTGGTGYVAVRYDYTNDYLYVYNGGWKKSSAYA